jgi:hypothetical protein
MLVKFISKILWVICARGAAQFALAYFPEIVFRHSPEISAPQLAALAAESLTYAIIPYVLARSWDEAWK